MNWNYLTAKDLNDILSMVETLNAQWPNTDLAFDVKVIDANGETLGEIKFSEDKYAFYMGEDA